MSHIITMHENQPSVSHRVVAERTENQQVSISNIINKYILDFEEFGKVHFKNEAIKNSKNKVNEVKTFLLNQEQTTLLLTYLKNSSAVRAFKVALVKEFYKMREELYPKQPQITNTTDRERIGTLETQLYMLKNENRELRRAMNRVAYNDEELPKIEGAYQRKYGNQDIAMVTDVKGSAAKGIKVEMTGDKITGYIKLEDFYRFFKEVKAIEIKLLTK